VKAKQTISSSQNFLLILVAAVGADFGTWRWHAGGLEFVQGSTLLSFHFKVTYIFRTKVFIFFKEIIEMLEDPG
jgi:hypothetical protein